MNIVPSTMNDKRSACWKTKEDVMKDLGAIGQAINDNCLVIRNGPPPRIKEQLDEEYNLRFGNASYSDKPVIPDLNCITKFIRMINDHDSSQDETPIQKNSKIVVSKLNPFVEEFVPRPGVNSQASNEKIKEGGKSRRKSPRSPKDPSYSNNSIGSPKKIQKSNLNLSTSDSPAKSIKGDLKSPRKNASNMPQNDCVQKQEELGIEIKGVNGDVGTNKEEIIDITNELRNKISETFKSNSPKHRRDRNVAIANLLKLHSTKPSPCSSKSNISTSTEGKALKLYSPDYFQNTTKHEIPSSLDNDESKDEATGTENEETIVIENIEKDELTDSSIQESIDKVNKWFDPEPSPCNAEMKKTSMSPIKNGPVSFKKKNTNAKSTVDVAQISKSTSAVAQFKPSKYADDLTEKYMKRSQEIERRHMSIWDSVEMELKKKDEQIKKKMAANRNV